MPSPTGPSLPPSHDPDVEVGIDVFGSVPRGLSGRLIGIGRDAFVYSVALGTGRTVSYRGVRVRTDAALHHVVAFGGALLAFGDDSPAYELSADLDTLHRVDLAGQGRALTPFPKHDSSTGELHLVALAADGTQDHIVVSAGALTRRSRSIIQTPNRITDLVLTRDRIVFVADDFVGVASRDGGARTTWIQTGATSPHPVHAHDAGDTVVLLVLTPSLERWTVRPAAETVHRVVLDPTPRRFAHCGRDADDGTPRLLWTTGDETVTRHDLANSRDVHRSLRPHVPGDLVFVPDTARAGEVDGGWLVGFVHDTSRAATELRVFDAADIAGPAIATAHIPRLLPLVLRCTWIPSIQRAPTQQ